MMATDNPNPLSATLPVNQAGSTDPSDRSTADRASAGSAASVAPWVGGVAQSRISELSDAYQDLALDQVAGEVRAQLREHHRSFEQDGIVLYAGTNILSAEAAAAHDGALSTRPSLGWPGAKVQTGMEHVEALEVLATQLVARSMHGRFAEVRFPTATMANLAVYTVLANPGDTIAVLSPAAGGHSSHHQDGAASIRALNVVHLPYDADVFDVDLGQLDAFLEHHAPRIVVIGGSVALFPHDVAMIRRACDRVDAFLLYDASHNAGLIAAGLFQDPLAEGAHVVTFSTYKSYAGPAGGAAVTNDERLAEALSLTAHPVMTSNYDTGRLGPLAIAAAEMIAKGHDILQPALSFAQQLAVELENYGLPMIGAAKCYTQTHQILIDAGRFGTGREACGLLTRAGIHVGAGHSPTEPVGSPAMGIRVGTQELVRSGAGPEHLAPIADLIARVLIDQEAPELVRPDTLRIRQSFGSAVDVAVDTEAKV